MTMIRTAYASLTLTRESYQGKAIWPEQQKYIRISLPLFLTIR
jgi:hypothetical protein